MIQHEAAHFLMGHLLGLPIKGYATNAVKSAVEFYPLNDPEIGRDRAQSLGFERSTRAYENEIAPVDRPRHGRIGVSTRILSTN